MHATYAADLILLGEIALEMLSDASTTWIAGSRLELLSAGNVARMTQAISFVISSMLREPNTF